MERMGPLLDRPRIHGTLAPPCPLFPWMAHAASRQGINDHEAHAVCFDPLSPTDVHQRGIRCRCSALSSRRSRKIARAGCRRERHSSGTCKCARAQRLGQRSQRHRQRRQSARDSAADHNAGGAADRIPQCRLPRAAGAAHGKDQTNAICGIPIARLGRPRGRQRAGQADQRQGSKHLPGMLNSVTGLKLATRDTKAPRPGSIAGATEHWIPPLGSAALARYRNYGSPCD
jgi:hypothetical protein